MSKIKIKKNCINTILVFCLLPLNLTLATDSSQQVVSPSQRPKNKCIDNMDKSWLDLKEADCYLDATTKSTELAQAIKDYESIRKDDERRFQDRINALKRIAKLSVSQMKWKGYPANDPYKMVLQQLITRANLKADYIKKLGGLRKEAEARARNIPKDQLNGVVNMKYEHELLEDLDPEKRVGHFSGLYGDGPYSKWKYYVEKYPESTPDYFIWLEEQVYNPKLKLLKKDLRHTFLSKDAKKVTFKEGMAYNRVFRANDSRHLMDGRYIYNISEDGDLYILPDTLHRKEVGFLQNPRSQGLLTSQQKDNDTLPGKGLNHDNILEGANILCAGMVFFKNGKIDLIDTDSGHYKPKMIQNLRPALAKLLKKYPDAISPDTQVGNYDQSVKMPYKKLLTITVDDINEKEEPPLKYEDAMLLMGQNLKFKPRT